MNTNFLMCNIAKTQIKLTVQWMVYEAHLGSKPSNDIIQAA